ncbi:glycine-rich cell wall structural protein 1.0-like [Ctenocephalides felis]|uniref:glycine-rich cell wall structural protein 1.0-like n=1 Tax=Ctenocephalides felis TaxID=7515 RepID=UPI000E6E57EA|nr:glycine-rich cell wall structural protein 1.0-like [Ctenocephalides felis]
MFIKAFITVGLASMVLARPQFITFKDGRVGVNFGGYHASAGLGGLLTGDSAHGGLQAEAGTPWGARAGAGLGGDASGQGAMYAEARSPWGRAGAGLGGDLAADDGPSGNAIPRGYKYSYARKH